MVQYKSYFDGQFAENIQTKNENENRNKMKSKRENITKHLRNIKWLKKT